MQQAAEIKLLPWQTRSRGKAKPVGLGFFTFMVLGCSVLSALLASWLPLQVSVVTLFLFAGPHNWFELRYFLLRMPVRFGRSRTYFLTAFAGIGVLTIAYLTLPILYNFNAWSRANWSTPIAVWNTLLLLWIGILVWLRGKQKPRADWSMAIPAAFFLIGINWVAPEMFSLGIVYLHPLVALWFLDRHLQRTQPECLSTYRRCLWLLPCLIGLMYWRLGSTPNLADDNGLFWRITQHAGAQLLPNLSSHLLVSVHMFLEMLHYVVWILALPLIGASGKFWHLQTIPLARHPSGFPRVVLAVLLFGVFLTGLLWFGFSSDYSTTRDLYFTLAIAHVLAEAPFLLKML